MAVDFKSRVLAPNFRFWGVKCRFLPIESQPEAQPFERLGIFESRPVDVSLLDNGVMGTQNTTLDIMLDDFQIALVQRDRVDIVDPTIAPIHRGLYWIDDVDPDGQGAATLTLRRMSGGGVF